MREQKSKNNISSCLVRIISILLLALAVVLFGLKLYTNWLVRQAEIRYPPAEFVTVEGLRLHYLSKGSGRPVVFIGGRNSKIQDFTLSPLFDPVTAAYKVIFIDRPGLGYSENPREAATAALQAHLIHNALLQLGVEKPVLVGQSWGGVIVLEYALDYPDSLSGIVLLGSSPYPRERPSNSLENIIRTPVIGDLVLHTLYVPIARQIAPRFLQESVEYFAPLTTLPPSYTDTTIELALRPNIIKADAEEQMVVPQGLETVSTQLSKITMPVVIVTGNLDTYAIQQSRRLKEDIPNSKVIVIEGAHHYFWFAYPEIVVDAIRDTWVWADSP